VRNRHQAGCCVAGERAADRYTLICEEPLLHDPRRLDLPSCRAFVPLGQDRLRVASRSMKIWIPNFGVARFAPCSWALVKSAFHNSVDLAEPVDFDGEGVAVVDGSAS
jgi:hypothetical protein